MLYIPTAKPLAHHFRRVATCWRQQECKLHRIRKRPLRWCRCHTLKAI